MKAIGNPSPTVSWTGRDFEDFTVGDVYRHPLGRTVLEHARSVLAGAKEDR